MAQAATQRTFAGGEVSDAISARRDLIKSTQGLRVCLNGFIGRSGAWLNDSGTKFVAEVKDSSSEVDPAFVEWDAPETLIPFVFNAEQSYVLEFGAGYVRFHRFGEPLYVAPSAYSAGTNYVPGDVVSHGGSDYYCVLANGPASTVVTPGTSASVWYELPVPPAYYTGTGTGILEIPTPYAAGEITKQNVRQSGDVLFIVHKFHAPRRLERLADLTWRLVVTRFRPNIASPTGLATTTFGGNHSIVFWQVTAVSKETGEESCVGHYTGFRNATVDAANAVDVRLIDAAHGLVTGDRIYISVVAPGSVGDTNTVLKQVLEERDFFVTRIDANTFSLDDTSGIPFDIAHTVSWHFTSLQVIAEFNPNRPITLKCTEVSEAAEYRWYASVQASNSPLGTGLLGYIGSSIKPQFPWGKENPDYETVAPFYPMEFEREDRHPHTCDFVQQRIVYARSERFPRGVRMSTSANFENFSASSPPADDDAVSTTITGTEANEVRQVIGIGPQLVVMTLGTENAIRGDGDGIITPNANSQRVHGYNGTSNVRPILIGAAVVYIPREMNGVRSLSFDSVADSYIGGDMTIFASHLVDGQRLVDLAYARVPHSIAHVARHDGVLLGMTHIPEHEILAWHRWTTLTLAGGSRVLSLCVIPEDGVSIVYMLVERVINGATVRYVEKKMRRCLAWDLENL